MRWLLTLRAHQARARSFQVLRLRKLLRPLIHLLAFQVLRLGNLLRSLIHLLTFQALRLLELRGALSHLLARQVLPSLKPLSLSLLVGFKLTLLLLGLLMTLDRSSRHLCKLHGLLEVLAILIASVFAGALKPLHSAFSGLHHRATLIERFVSH